MQSIQSDIIETYNLLFDISKNVKKEREIQLLQLPYHINVIDELHINENAHSRILTKLLQFKNTNGQYEILTSFIDYIKKEKKSSPEFERIKIDSPVITQEKERIDLWVRDYASKYAIIFENKIYDAADQEAQLYRYIEKTRICGFLDPNIFILYLTKFGDKEPSDQTWGGEKENYQSRYLVLSFRDDVLVWLKNIVIPNIRQKDVYLLNAVSQYVDYLEGLFSLRKINKSLNMDLQKIISERLGLYSCGNKEALNKIEETIKDFQEVLNQLESMQREKRIDYWREQMNLVAPLVSEVEKTLGLKSEYDFINENETRFYISFKKNEWELSIVFERYDNDTTFIYIGLPGEGRVNDLYLVPRKYAFKEHSEPQTEPYGWEYVDKYHKSPDTLVQDIQNGVFKEFLINEVTKILKKISDNDIKMKID